VQRDHVLRHKKIAAGGLREGMSSAYGVSFDTSSVPDIWPRSMEIREEGGALVRRKMPAAGDFNPSRFSVGFQRIRPLPPLLKNVS
jgi:hypothetical protein